MGPRILTSPAEDVRGAGVPVEVVALDAPARRAASYAERKVRRALATERRPVLHARVTLARAHDPAVVRPARAQVTVDLNGRIVRARAAARTLPEAIDTAASRLRAQLVRLDGRRRRPRRAATRP